MKSYISKNPQILGGKPVIAGTRVPVARILFLLKEGYTLEAIHEEYPHVGLKLLDGAVRQVIRFIDTNKSHGAQIL